MQHVKTSNSFSTILTNNLNTFKIIKHIASNMEKGNTTNCDRCKPPTNLHQGRKEMLN